MNKSEMMRKAHKLARAVHRASLEMGMADSYSATFAECLRLVWVEARGGEAVPRNADALRDAYDRGLCPFVAEEGFDASRALRWWRGDDGVVAEDREMRKEAWEVVLMDEKEVMLVVGEKTYSQWKAKKIARENNKREGYPRVGIKFSARIALDSAG